MAHRKPRRRLPASNGQLATLRRTQRVDVFTDDLDPRTERRYEFLRRLMEEPPVARPPHLRRPLRK